jgi:cyclophilin family peptidyl-prolyl cis-trans isomerase
MRQKAGRQARLEAARQAEQKSKRNKTVRNVAIIVVVVVAALFLFSRLGNDNSGVSTADSTTTSAANATTTTAASTTPLTAAYGSTPCPNADGSSPRTIEFTDQPAQCIDPTKTYTATFKTSEGDVTVNLDPAQAPGAVNDFVVLARYHYYDNTSIFRTNTGIGIFQGGSPHTQNNTDQGPGFSVEDEGVFNFNDPNSPNGKGPYTYEAGDLVLARASGPNSSGAQFFFGVDDNVSQLDSAGTYIKLGLTTQGLDVLQKILALHKDTDASQPGEGAPSKPVTVQSVTIQES